MIRLPTFWFVSPFVYPNLTRTGNSCGFVPAKRSYRGLVDPGVEASPAGLCIMGLCRS